MPAPENPYAPPLHDPTLPEPVAEGLILATRGERFVGAFVDGLVNFAIVVAFFFGFLGLELVDSFAELNILPFAGGVISLVNILFIFRADKRCLHDLIAGTQVVK